ncbi:acetate non-utilizing protein 9, mitochondrial [Pseudohyphozyma bogoriensis]|nr:acetate non-utilizing protein 9, mitochondrial [Pseudohyphozyma bogoriensis]
MRTSIVRLAASTSKKPLGTSAFTSPPTDASLIPPIPLYRRLLRVHRKVLPIEMRVLGDDYVKQAEFRRTKSTDNPLHIVGFLSEWQKYLEFHEKQLVEADAEKARREGQKMKEELFEKLSAEQIGQLHELMLATQEVWADPAEIEREREAARLSAVEPASNLAGTKA